MKYYISFLALLVLALFAGCSNVKEDSCCMKPASASGAAVTKSATPPSAISDLSLFNLESEWVSQAGQKLQLQELGGRVQLVAMIYTGCNYACPRIIADLKRIEGSLEQFNRQDIGITLVTMDPANDTPKKLQQFARSNNLDPKRWLLLTSSPDNIRELAGLLNMKYKTEADGEISHSNIITVLSAEGEVVHQQEGLGIDPDETVKSIKGLLQRI